MNTHIRGRVVLAVSGLAVIAALAGCGPSHSTASAAAASGTAAAHAFATSSAGRLAGQDARSLFVHCLPAGNAQYTVSGWEGAAKCGGVPRGSRLAAARCMMGRIFNKPFPADKQARDEAMVNAAYPCIQQFQRKSP